MRETVALSQEERKRPENVEQPEIVLSPAAEAGLDRLAAVLRKHNPANCVLLVEDNPADVHLIEAAFRIVDETLKVLVVGGGVDAINYLDGKEEFSDRSLYPLPTAILLDMGLPDTTGIEILKYIRKSAHLQRSIVIALTGSDDAPNALQAEGLGINAYLLKPDSGSYVHLIRGLRSSGLI